MKKVTLLLSLLFLLTGCNQNNQNVSGSSSSCNHIWDEGIETLPPTHVDEGLLTYTCTECGETKTETIPATSEHSFNNWLPLNEETHYSTCICGEIKYESHHFNNGDVITEATHVREGTIQYTCNDCGYKTTEPIATTSEHSYGDYKKVDDEYHKRTCECGSEIVERHAFEDGDIIKEATAFEDGSKYRVCTMCEHKIVVSIPKLNPTYIHHNEVPATTEADGVKEHYTIEGLSNYYIYENDQYVLTSFDDLVIPKLYSEWNGDIDFEKFCTNGDCSERVTATTQNDKLRLSLSGSLHYGEYRPAQVYKINYDGEHKYILTIKNFVFSADSGSNSLIAVKIKFENGNTVDVSNYYFSLYEMDITSKLSVGDNYFSLIFVTVFGSEGESKAGCYVDIDQISLKTVKLAPAEQTFDDRELDLDTYFLSGTTEHLGVSAHEDGIKFTTEGFADKWGAVVISTDWQTNYFESCYIDLTISEITPDTKVIAQVKFATQEYYLDCNLTSAGTHRIKLASFQSESLSGNQTFKFRFGLEGWGEENNFSAVISSIKFIPPVTHTVRFYDDASNLLYSTDVLDGGSAVYVGDVPTKQEDDEFSYEFIGWDKSLDNIIGDVDFYAQFNSIPKEDWGELKF